MLYPGMFDLPRVMALSGYTEEEVLDCGISGQLIFVCVVPELGACRVPELALSHFMAGAESFDANAMPEHYRGSLSGAWTIRRDRLRILADSWEDYAEFCQRLARALEHAPQADELPQAAPAVGEPAGLPDDPMQKRAALLAMFREAGGKRQGENGKSGTRGALARVVEKSGIDKDTLGTMLDKAIDEKRGADAFAQLAAKR